MFKYVQFMFDFTPEKQRDSKNKYSYRGNL